MQVRTRPPAVAGQLALLDIDGGRGLAVLARSALAEPLRKTLSREAWRILETGSDADTPRELAAWAVGVMMAGHVVDFRDGGRAGIYIEGEHAYRGGSMDRGWSETTRTHFLVVDHSRKVTYFKVPWSAVHRLVRPELITDEMIREMSAAGRLRRDLTGYDKNGRPLADRDTWYAVEDRCYEAAAKVWDAMRPRLT